MVIQSPTHMGMGWVMYALGKKSCKNILKSIFIKNVNVIYVFYYFSFPKNIKTIIKYLKS